MAPPSLPGSSPTSPLRYDAGHNRRLVSRTLARFRAQRDARMRIGRDRPATEHPRRSVARARRGGLAAGGSCHEHERHSAHARIPTGRDRRQARDCGEVLAPRLSPASRRGPGIDDGGLNELSHISVDRDAVHPCDDPHRRRRRSCIRVASARSAIALTSPRGRVGLVGSSLVVPELEAALVHVNRSPIVGAHQAH